MAVEASTSVKKMTLNEAAGEGSSSQASKVAATELSTSVKKMTLNEAAGEGSSSQASEVAATELSASEAAAAEVSESEEAALGKKITLISSDGVEFVLDETVAMESQTIKHMIEDDCAESAIPLPNVSGNILAKVIEYSKKHVESAPKANPEMAAEKALVEELKKWDAEFVKVDQGTLFQMILAANYLNIKGMLELTCQTVADMMRGKTPDEIRTLFNITNDYTAEEEAEVRRANQWAFE